MRASRSQFKPHKNATLRLLVYRFVLRVAYLANQFPTEVEPYVGDEIQELRARGVEVIACSVRRPNVRTCVQPPDAAEEELLSLQPLRVRILFQAFAMIVRRWKRISDLLIHVLLRGKELPQRRMKAMLHTWLGAYYAVLLCGRKPNHIHIHHGYFGAWIAMVASRLLDVDFSLTLHGSDLLLNSTYLDAKLKNCSFCITISEYNRRYILDRFPEVNAAKILVSRLGVEVSKRPPWRGIAARDRPRSVALLAVGRLHRVKDHGFLIRACALMRDRGMLDFECAIAGDGPERQRLQRLIHEEQLQERITLLGHMGREGIDSLYRRADVVVLTSRSEGIPLVLMEAMALRRIVLAPAITGIPELVLDGKTGFLYSPGVLQDFVEKIFFLAESISREDRDATSRLDWIRHAARVQVQQNFNRSKNLSRFGNLFLERMPSDEPGRNGRSADENTVLQQI
jgi:colanic acid/amylovoran biosynthesis glycosyltransferase